MSLASMTKYEDEIDGSLSAPPPKSRVEIVQLEGFTMERFNALQRTHESVRR